MVHKLEETVSDKKTPGLNNSETYNLTHNQINTYKVSIFCDLNKAQIYRMPYRDSAHNEIEIVTSFKYLYLLKPNGRKQDDHSRKPNDEMFLNWN